MRNGGKCAACLAAVLFVLLAFVVDGAKSIICYKCNSKYDSRCGDPFIPYTIALVDCNITDVPSHLPGKEPGICRKTVQRVHKSVRIVRDCGYVEDPAHDDQDCYSRPGSHDIEMTHCSCTSSMCNGSTGTTAGRFLGRLSWLLCAAAAAYRFVRTTVA